MGQSDILPILLVFLTILANGAVVNANIRIVSNQDIVNSFFKSYYGYVNQTRNNEQDVEVLVKDGSKNGVGSGLNRKATDYYQHVKSRSDAAVDDDAVEVFDKPEVLMKMGVEQEPTAEPTNSMLQTQTPEIIGTYLDSSRPSFAFTFNSTTHIHSFEVARGLEQEYFISVVVENMNCPGKNDDTGQAPKLIIKGIQEENGREICGVFSNSYNSFQSVNFCADVGKHVTIMPVGDWFGVSVSLVVSLYYETLDGCDACTTNDHFCCGNSNAACPGSSFYHRFSGFSKELTRCIPKASKGQNGKSLVCDGHPNCGLYSNKDESDEFCSNDDHGNDYGSCYTCRVEQQDRILLTILLLIVFCVFVPFCIFLVFCSKREVRAELRQDGRCPMLIEILFCPFSINADNPNGGARVNPARPPRRNPRTPVRRSDEVNGARQTETGQENFSYFDDLPPPYSECCHNKSVYPNPPKFPRNLGVTYPSQHEFRTTTPATSSSTPRTVPTVSLQVLTISSLVNERPPPSFEVVTAGSSTSRSKDAKKKEVTRAFNKSSRTDANIDGSNGSNNSNVAVTNDHS